LSVSTDSAGKYSMILAAGSYRVYTNGSSSYKGQVYRDKTCASTCDPSAGDLVTVADGTDATGIDFHLDGPVPLTKLAGRVTDSHTGAGMGSTTVTAISTTTQQSYSRTTDADGNYVLVVPTGSYYVKAAPQSPYFTTVLGGKACSDPNACDAKTGTPAAVSNPTTLNLQVARIRIDHVTPDSGPIAGGTRIAIAGSDFTPQTKVSINGSSVAVISQTPTELVVATPPSAVDGPVHISAGENSSTTVVLPNAFTYVAGRRHVTRR